MAASVSHARVLRHPGGGLAGWPAAYAAAAAGVAALNAIAFLLRPGGGQTADTLTEWAYLAAIAVALAGLCAGMVGARGDERLAFGLLAAGAATGLAGELVLGLPVALGGQGTSAAVTLADAFYLATFPLWFAGLYVRDRRRLHPPDGGQGLADTAICMTAAAIFFWHFLGDPHRVDLPHGTLAQLVYVAYPIGNLGLLFVLLQELYRYELRWNASHVLLAGGMGTFVAGDLIIVLPVGTALNVLYAVALIAIGLAGPAARLERERNGEPPRAWRRPRTSVAMPFLFSAAVAALLVASYATGGTSMVVVAGTVILFGLVCLRLALTLRENDRLLAQAESHATTDALTGLRNARYFHDRLRGELHRAARGGSEVGLLLIDVDGLKQVNDAYGHGAGDRLLKAAGAATAGACRTGDVACRVGGDELAVIAPDLSAGEAAGLAERVAATVREATYEPNGESGRLHASASVGAAAYPTDAAAAEGLVERADAALYAAKRLGGGRAMTASRPAPAPGA